MGKHNICLKTVPKLGLGAAHPVGDPAPNSTNSLLSPKNLFSPLLSQPMWGFPLCRRMKPEGKGELCPCPAPRDARGLQKTLLMAKNVPLPRVTAQRQRAIPLQGLGRAPRQNRGRRKDLSAAEGA